MHSFIRLIVALVAVHACCATATADYVGLECEIFEDPQWAPNGYSGLQTIRLYAAFDDPADSVFAVFGDVPSPLIATSEGDGSFYNDALFDSLTAPVDFTFIHWSNQWDTYVTIDTTDADGDQTTLTPFFAEETNGLQSDFVTDNAAWFVTPNALPQGLAGPEGRVLLAQFTVADDVPGWGVSGSASLQMRIGGNVIVVQDQFFYCVSEVFAGACCLGDGTCVDDVTEADCVDMGGEYQGDFSLCVDAPCPGACCLPGGNCIPELLEEECDEMAGVYQGDGTTCDPFPCLGACCLPDGTCVDTWPEDCAASGGVFQGLGTNCSEFDCTWACCLPDGICELMTLSECEAMAGDFSPLLGCEDVQCIGACCVNGVCFSFESELNCLAAGGIYLGDGIPCGGDVCPPSCPGDLDGSGDVGFSDLVQLLAAWGPCV